MGWHPIMPILPIYSLDLGASVFMIGIITAMFPITLIMILIPFRFIATSIDVKKVLIFSFFTQIAALVLLVIAEDPILLFPVVALFGVGFASFLPISTSLSLAMASKGDRGSVGGKYFVALGSGMVIGPLLMSYFLNFFSYREVFLFLIIFPISGLLLLANSLAAHDIIPFISDRSRRLKKSVRNVLFDSSISVLFVTHMFFFLTIGLFNTLFPIYAASSLGYTASMVSLLFAVRGGFNVLIRIPSGSFSDHVGRKKILIVSSFFPIACFILLAFASNIYIITFALVLFGLAWGIKLPISSAAIGDKVKIEQVSLTIAMFYTSGSIGSLVGSVLAGVTGTRYPWYTIMLPLIFLMIISALLIIYVYTEK